MGNWGSAGSEDYSMAYLKCDLLLSDWTKSQIKQVQRISSENMKSPCVYQQSVQIRMNANSLKVEAEGEKEKSPFQHVRPNTNYGFLN